MTEFIWRDDGYDEFGQWDSGDNRVLLKIAKARPTRGKVSKILLKLENGMYSEAPVVFKKLKEEKTIFDIPVEDIPLKNLF